MAAGTVKGRGKKRVTKKEAARERRDKGERERAREREREGQQNRKLSFGRYSVYTGERSVFVLQIKATLLLNNAKFSTFFLVVFPTKA